MITICPCCGQNVPDANLIVSLETNTASRGSRVAKLENGQADILSVLAAAWPGIVTHATIANALWGTSSGPSNESVIVRVTISAMRKRIKPLGVKIVPVYGRGYRLEFDMPEAMSA